MLTIIAIVLVVLVAAVLVIAAIKPYEFRVQRATSITARPEKIFALINDFHRWPSWSPYEKLDPAMKRTVTGAASGKGAVYEWEGNNKAGKGRMEIVDSSPPSKIAIDLSFVRPFRAHNAVDFTLQPGGDSTSVTWAMNGHSPYVMKLMGTFVNMDRMIGKDFETGLANLKTVAES
ncbi:MAG: SRPBCC family protein [Gemmatimonadota bacterium]|nr:SRPBCC family protein [Gemmatimonadota bacterium]